MLAGEYTVEVDKKVNGGPEVNGTEVIELDVDAPSRSSR